MNFPPSFFKEIKKLKESGFSVNKFIVQAVAEKFKRDFNIDIDTTDRRQNKSYHKN
jgi:hypothetical protein